MCDIPCAQDDSEACGGRVDHGESFSPLNQINATIPTNSTLAARTTNHQNAPDMLLTVYGDLSAEPMPLGAPAMGGCPVETKTATTSLTVPTATPSKEAAVTTVAVQTVVPVIANATAPAKGTAVPYAAAPRPSASNIMPVEAAAPPSDKAATAVWTLGWGLALWFGVFGVMSVV